MARSCFQLWPKIGDEGDKFLRKKTGDVLAETVFFEIGGDGVDGVTEVTEVTGVTG